jgi:hypothetical protein
VRAGRLKSARPAPTNGAVNAPEEVTSMKIRAYRLMSSTTAVSALAILLAAPKKW